MAEKFFAIVEFEDGLQVIPNNWLNEDLEKAAWPNFTTNKRYDNAVKTMEEPQSSWVQHPIRKIYGKYPNYTLARKKLKDAEELSDINSDRDEILKNTRKFRAAKHIETYSDEEYDKDLTSGLPKMPIKTTRITEKKDMKGVKMSQKGISSTFKNVYDEDDKEDEEGEKTGDDENDNESDTFAEQSETDLNESDNEIKNNNIKKDQKVILKTNTSKSILNNNPESNKEFQRFVISKLVNLELHINAIERNQKLILEKIPSSINFEEEAVDISQELPLKNQEDLQAMETKLINDPNYRNQIIKQLTLMTCQDVKTSCLRLMKILFTNELAVQFSWYGAKKKKIFSKLYICKVIMSVIRKVHKNATDEQISNPIKIWLAHAKERIQRQAPILQAPIDS